MTDLSRGKQRALVLAVLVVLVGAFVFWPSPGHERQAAHAATSCGANDANRNSLALYTNGTMTPCVAKPAMRLLVTRSGSWPSETVKWTVAKVRTNGTKTLKYADGTSSSVVHMTFEQFKINTGASLTVDGANYDLTMVPDSTAQFGAAGINTDLWVDGNSTFTVKLLGACTTITVNLLNTFSWLLNGTDWDGCDIDLKIRYMTSYKASGSSTGSYPIRMPNTTFTAVSP